MPSKTFALILTICLFGACKKDPDVQKPWQQEMLEQVNSLRQAGCQCGAAYMPPAPPLTWNDTLAAAADIHVKDMYERQYFDHISPDGTSPIQRAQRAGYKGTYIGENIAKGYSSVSTVMEGWKNSESHCKAMMDGLYRQMGAATTHNYWVQEFGTPQ
jgi:uncharacterized protein YkwD